MDITLDSYITNPLGKHNAVFNHIAREAMKDEYVKRYSQLLVREHGLMRYYLYRDEKRNRYYAHFKVPSEAVDKFYYDVVFEFYTDQHIEEGGKNMLKYYVNFFSNDPAFVYTYAYAFKHNDILIKDLEPKMSKKALRERPKEKNPGESTGYVKAIYFAYLYFIQHGLANANRFAGEVSPYSKGYLQSQVEDADIKIHQREIEQEKLNKKKKKEKEAKKQQETDNIKVSKRSTNITTTKKITSGIKKVSSVKTTKKK